MARDLADVLHYFLPELESDSPIRPAPRAPAEAAARAVGDVPDSATRELVLSEPRHPAALPLVGVPIGDRDVVRAAFTWNLAIEISRLGGRAAIVVPGPIESGTLWPSNGAEARGPMGAQVHHSEAANLRELQRAAIDVAVDLAVGAEEGGVVFVRIPPPWLSRTEGAERLLRWNLLFTSVDRKDLLESYGIAKLILRLQPAGRVGVTVHGARRIEEAASAFSRLARTAEQNVGSGVTSYGLLVDDLHVYRAIVAQRPIGLAHPQSPAARALRDVARMLLEDAREIAVV